MKEASAHQLQSLVSGLRSGELPLKEYLGSLEKQFELIEPQVKAFISEPGRFDRLYEEAESIIKKYPKPINRPALFGVPVGVKDIFHVDGFYTRAGSKLPEEELKGHQAQSVRVLKEAGALILGKTVTTEFAYFDPGPTRNPHNLNHTPGGSSSGSAAAVAAGLSPVAIGTQTIGSIIRPASYCGVVGYKPSYDRISRYGVIPLAPSLDHVGVFAADVLGAELLASLLCPDWQLAVRDTKPVLGIPVGPYLERASPLALAHFQDVCARLRKAGCQIKQVPVMADFTLIEEYHNLILAAEAAQVHAHWYAAYGDQYHPNLAALIERGRAVGVGKLAEALADRRRLRKELTAIMDHEGLDLWISPAATGPAPEGLESTGDPIMNLPWTNCGLPVVNLPAGTVEDGLPIGLQVTGRWYDDEGLLEWCAQMELIVS